MTAFLAEAAADLLGQRWRTALLFACLTGIAVGSFLLHGEAARSRHDLQGMLDAADSRVVRIQGYQQQVAVDPATVRAALQFAAVTDAVGLSAPASVVNDDAPGGRSSVLRWATDPPFQGGVTPLACHEARATGEAAATLGMLDGRGEVLASSAPVAVIGTGQLRAGFSFLSGLLARHCGSTPLHELVVTVDSTYELDPVEAAVTGLFAAQDRARLRVDSPAPEIRRAREVAETAQASASRATVAAVGSATAIATVLLAAMVMQRRVDFGRRRALGASQGYVVSLIIAESVLLAASATAAAYAATSIAAASSDVVVLPAPRFAVGTVLMLVAGTSVGGALAGTLAAARNPVAEIRVP